MIAVTAKPAEREFLEGVAFEFAAEFAVVGDDSSIEQSMRLLFFVRVVQLLRHLPILLHNLDDLRRGILQPGQPLLLYEGLPERLPVDADLLLQIPRLLLQLLLSIPVELIDQNIFNLLDLRHPYLDVVLCHFDGVGACQFQLLLCDSNYLGCYFLEREK